MKKLLAGVLVSCTLMLSNVAFAIDDHSGVWQGQQLGYIMVRQNGNNLVATLLLESGFYQAFYGSLDTTGKKATLSQLFTTSKIELEVNIIDSSSATIQLVTCKDAQGAESQCLIPQSIPFPIKKIF
jgi:hypothetical protein